MQAPPGNRNSGGGGNGNKPPGFPKHPISEPPTGLASQTLVRTLSKTYQIQERLGAGGMGAVHKAVDMENGAPVVVKFVLKRNLRGMTEEERNSAMERFKREAKLAASVVHPNVIRTLDLGFHDGDPFIVLEHFPGEDIYEIYKKCVELDARGRPAQDADKNYTLLLDAAGRPFVTWSWVGSLMMDVCEGLNAAHVKQIMHRDIKPGNIMATMVMGDDPLRPLTAVKVLDFGLAKFVYDQGTKEELTRLGVIAGTPEYMAPEQVTRAQSGANAIDHRVDIYAVGAVMYRLITGKSAFSPELDGLLERMNRMPEAPSVFRPDLPPAVDNVILTAMATKREDRYPTAIELKRAIADSLGYVTPQPARTQVTLADIAPALQKKSGRMGKTIAAIVAATAIGVGGYLAYDNRDMIKQKMEKLSGSSKKQDETVQDEKKGYVVKVESAPQGTPIFRVVKAQKMVKGKMKEVEDEIFLGNTPLSTVLPPGEHKLRARKKWRQPKDMTVSPEKPVWKFRFY